MVPSKKRAVILGEPICWYYWATDLSRKERGKVVSSKRGRRARPGGHEENWFLRKKLHLLAGTDSWISV